MAGTDIAHTGKIVEITPSTILVEIVSNSACSSCHAAGFCGVSEAVKKMIEVPATYGNWSVGQEVEVNLKRSMGFKAVWLAYAIPLVVLMAVLLGLNAAGMAELSSGLIAIAAVAVYYFVLWLFRDRLRNEYSFYIKEK